MRSEQLESIVSLLRDSEEDGPTTVEEWRAAYDKLGSLVPVHDGVWVWPGPRCCAVSRGSVLTVACTRPRC